MLTTLLRRLNLCALVALTLAPSGCKRAKAEVETSGGEVALAVDVSGIAEEAYIYGYPLVSMELTRRVMTNVGKPTGSRAPMGQFATMRSYPDASFHDVTTPNANTLYSVAWIDVGKEPYILSLPDEKGRYYLMPMLDAWTNVFASPGTRTTGTGARKFLIVGPKWSGDTPAGMTLYRSATSLVWILGRTFAQEDPEDFAVVHELQDQYALTPVSGYGGAYTPPPGRVDRTIDMKTPVRDQVSRMPAMEYFDLMARLMAANPPAPEDSAIVARMATIGLVPGRPFDGSRLSDAETKTLSTVVRTAWPKIAAVKTPPVNGWSYSTNLAGRFGTHYLERAAVAAYGLGANLPEDAIYPAARADADGNPLDGTKQYVIHFAKGEMPPVKAFWSITMYNDQYFFVQNPINRYQISPKQTPVKYNADGSLDIYVQLESPGAAREENWLPAPPGTFQLVLRMYWPEEAVINGSWKPPAVVPQRVTAAR